MDYRMTDHRTQPRLGRSGFPRARQALLLRLRTSSSFEESCIRKAIDERGLNSSLGGLADTTAEDERLRPVAYNKLAEHYEA
jgi:hypothetical protein